MRTPTRLYGAMVALLVAFAGIGVRSADAACNTIPPAALSYQSKTGGIRERLATPGSTVHLVHRACDGDTTFFDPVKANNEIRVIYVADPKDPSKDTPIGPFAPLEVRCDPVLPSVCPELVFIMPRTATTALPDGLAGQARIVVTLKTRPAPGNVAADIGELSELTSTCAKGSPDPDFGHFTALPEPNVTADLASASSVRATMDGHDDLLVPLDHTKAKSGLATRALFEAGLATFCAKKPEFLGICKWFASGFHIDERIAAHKHARGGIEAFSVEGHRLAPIVDHDDQGGVFGLADGDRSVLRIATGIGGGKNLDLAHLRTSGGKGPLVFANKTKALTNGTVVCHAAKIQGARQTADLVTHVDEQDLLDVHDVPSGAEDCGEPTKIMPDEIVLPTGEKERIVEARAGLVGTISNAKLQVLDASGAKLASGTDAAAIAPKVNRYALAVETDRIFFRNPQGELAEWSTKAKSATAIGRASVAEVREDRVVALDDANPAAAWTYDASLPMPKKLDLGAKGAQVANGPDVAAVALVNAGGPATLSTWLWPAGADPTSRDDTTAVVDANGLGVTAGCGGNACATRVAIVSSEAAQKAKLNGDADQTDNVLRLYRPESKFWEEPGLAASEFVTSDHYVAFRVPEDQQGEDLNGDLDRDDAVLQLVAFGSGGYRIVSTFFAATGWDGRWHELGWRTPYVLAGDQLLFLVEEAQQRTDLDGDGFLTSTVLAIFDIPSARIHVEIPHKFPNQFIFDKAGSKLTLLGNGFAIGDGDRDGVLDPFDSCVVRPNARQTDDDYDGLGDGVCDAGYCTDYVPPSRVAAGPAMRSSAVLRAAARGYLSMRAEIVNACLARLPAAPTDFDADALCRGSFVGAGENPGVAWSAPDRRALARAEARFLRALHAAGSELERHRYGRRVIRAYGEAVNAATRVARGDVGERPRATVTVGVVAAAVTDQLIDLVEGMQRCVLGRGGDGDLVACLGALQGGIVNLPPALRPAAAWPARLGAALREGDSCAAPTGDPTCLTCATWRNAVHAVLTLLGGVDPPTASLAPVRRAARD